MEHRYTYAAPLPALENKVFAALVSCGGQATAFELKNALSEEINISLIYTSARRLEAKGLLYRTECVYDFGPAGKATRTTYFKGTAPDQLEREKVTKMMGSLNQHTTAPSARVPFSTAAPQEVS